MISANDLKNIDNVLFNCLTFKNGYFKENRDLMIRLRARIAGELDTIKVKVSSKTQEAKK